MPGSALPTQQPEGYSIALTTSAGTSYVTVEAVQALRQVTIDPPDAGMPQQSGAPLREVLTAAGVTAFESVTITGRSSWSVSTARSRPGGWHRARSSNSSERRRPVGG